MRHDSDAAQASFPIGSAVAPEGDQLRLLLDALQHHGPVGVAWKTRRQFRWRSNLTLRQACSEVSRHVDGDIWFSANPTSVRGSGRGKTADVVGLTSLYADLDAKSDGLGSYDDCWAVISEVNERLGVTPTAVVDSGHGLQPYWRVADVRWDREDHDARRVATETLRAFGNLVAETAAKHGGSIDRVFDLPRILRVPGTTNVKEPERPRSARLVLLDPDAQPLDYVQLRQSLRVGAVSWRGEGGSDRGSGAPRDRDSVETLLREVEQATEGSRNQTLNRVVFILVRDLAWSFDVADRVRSAAVLTGLHEDEVERTISSALLKAQSLTGQADEWLNAVLVFLDRTRPRNRIALALAARHLRDLACRVDPPLGMSCRRLAGLMQIPSSTSALYLKALREEGWLSLEPARTDRLKPNGYQLTTPERWKLDSYPEEQTPYGELSNFARSHTGLFAHDAFSKRTGTTSLPKRCSVVLEVLRQHPEQIHPVAEIASRTTYSEWTVRTALHELESAGFLHYKRREGAVLVEGNEAWTDVWAAWSGAAGNSDARHRQHQAERERHARYGRPVGEAHLGRAGWLPKRPKE